MGPKLGIEKSRPKHLFFGNLRLRPRPQSVPSGCSNQKTVPQTCGFRFKCPERGSSELGPRLHASSRVLGAGLPFFCSGYHVALRAGEAKVAASRAEDSLCPPVEVWRYPPRVLASVGHRTGKTDPERRGGRLARWRPTGCGSP